MNNSQYKNVFANSFIRRGFAIDINFHSNAELFNTILEKAYQNNYENFDFNSDAANTLKEYAKSCDEFNAQLYDVLFQTYNTYKNLYCATLPINLNHKDNKKLLKSFNDVAPNRPQNQLYLVNDRFNLALRNINERIKNTKFEKEQVEKQNEKLRLHTSAIEFLKIRNYTIDTKNSLITLENTSKPTPPCLKLEDAVEVANEIRFQELVAEEPDEINHSCCDDCSTWFKDERRCACGNCRMSFSYNGDFEDMTIYPEAY